MQRLTDRRPAERPRAKLKRVGGVRWGAFFVAVALLLGFFAGWLSLSRRVFKLNRQNRALHQRLIKAGLEAEPVPQPKTRKRSGPPLEPPRS